MKKILLLIICVLFLPSLALAIPVQWERPSAGVVRPLYIGDSVLIPVLGGGGTLCLQVDNTGLVSTAATSCGSGGGGDSVWSRLTTGLIYTPTTTDSVAIGGTATTSAATEFWFDSVNNKFIVTSGRIGIGTTTPYAALSVVGQTVGTYFTATSTTQSSIFPYASTTALSATTLCLTADCRTSWPTGTVTSVTGTFPIISSGGVTPNLTFGGLSTSSAPTVGQLPYWTGVNTFGSVATGTISVPTGLTITANRYAIGGSAAIALDTGYVIPLQSTLDAKALGATTLTIAGTANQITSSAGAQDLSTNRTWILSLPSHVIFPGNFQATNATTTNATTTALDITNLLTFNSVTGNSWDDFCVAITGGSGLCDGTDATGGGSGGGSWSTTTSTVSGQDVNYSNNTTDIVAIGANSTTTAEFWFDPNTNFTQLGGIASSTKFIAGFGTQSLPAYTFSGDENTGIYNSGGDSLRIAAAGAAVIIFGNNIINNVADITSNTTGGNKIEASDGSINTPTYSFQDDVNTGLWSQGADILNLTAGGTETFRSDIASTSFPVGNIGIGTTSPYAKLSVVGPVVAAYLHATSTTNSTIAAGLAVGTGIAVGAHSVSTGEIRSNSSWVGSGPWVQSSAPSTGVLSLSDNAGTGFTRINFGGNTTSFPALQRSGTNLNIGLADGSVSGAKLGIGTSTPYAPLSVVGPVVAEYFHATSTTATSTITNALQIGGTAGDNGLKMTAGRVYPASVSVGGMVNLSNSTINSGPALVGYTNFGSSATGRLATFTCDNVAFDQDCFLIDNDAANTTALNVKGEPTGKGVLKIEHLGSGTGFSNASLISIDGLNCNDCQGLFMDFTTAQTTGKLLNLRNGGVELFTLTGSGNTGIGTTSPYAKLSVVGEVVAPYFTATTTNSTSTLPLLSVQTGLNFFGTFANSLDDLCVAITGSSGLCDGNDASGAGGGVWPFVTTDTNYGVAVQSTTTPLWFKNGLMASTTAHFVTSTTTLATIGTLNLTNDLTVANGGTGLSTFGGTNHVLYTTATDVLASEAAYTYNPSSDLLTAVNATFSGGTLTAGTLAGALDAGGATSFEIPNGTAGTVDAIGEVSLDTTDNQLLIATSTNASYPAVLPTIQPIWSTTVASTSLAFVSGGRLPLPSVRDGFEMTGMLCWVSGGTSVVLNVSNGAGTADTNAVTCTNGNAETAFTANRSVAALATSSLEVGTITGSVNYVSFTVFGQWVRK